MKHMQDLADIWNIDYIKLPHWGQPTHIMSMLSHIDQGTISVFWISGTNPLVSLPDLNRIRKLLTKEDLFVIVQDIFMTETAEIADVVLPAACWGEKRGVSPTSIARFISHIKPSNRRAKQKLISTFSLHFAKRMDFKDKMEIG